MAAWNKGKTKIYSKEARWKMGATNRGKISKYKGIKGRYSEETLQKMRDSTKGKRNGSNNPMFGRKHSKETKEKIGRSSKTRIFDDIARHHMSLSGKGKIVSKETREKLSIANKGRKHTEKTKEIIRKCRLNQKFVNKDTRIEKALKEELTRRNIIFEEQKTIFGRPDIFIAPNICIFCDGDYWHANPTIYKPEDIISRQHNRTAEEIWKKDWNITLKLTEQNYFVLRFWENDILKDVKSIGNRIEHLLGDKNE